MGCGTDDDLYPFAASCLGAGLYALLAQVVDERLATDFIATVGQPGLAAQRHSLLFDLVDDLLGFATGRAAPIEALGKRGRSAINARSGDAVLFEDDIGGVCLQIAAFHRDAYPTAQGPGGVIEIETCLARAFCRDSGLALGNAEVAKEDGVGLVVNL